MKSIRNHAAACIVSLLAAWTACSPASPPRVDGPPPLVAHAGGGLGFRTYTNSLEAIEANLARGHTLMELDFSWTSDGHVVLAHDWDADGDGAVTEAEIPDLARFLEERARRPLTSPTLEELLDWMRARPGFDVVTDCKSRNLDVLAEIARQAPDLVARFVVQIYHPDEHAAAAALGFERIILTLYARPLTDDEVFAHAAERAPWAVTMPYGRAYAGLPARLDELGVFTYAHTVNDRWTFDELRAHGIDGIYTDWLAPGDRQAGCLVFPDWERRVSGERPLDGVSYTYLPQKEVPLTLEFVNGGTAPATVVLSAADREGEARVEHELSVPPGSARAVVLRELFVRRPELVVLAVRADPGLTVEPRAMSPAGESVPWALVTATVDEQVLEGTGAGLVGDLVNVINPGTTTRIVRVQRRVGGELMLDAPMKIPPGGSRSRAFGFRTDARIEWTVSGGPVVVQHLRWDDRLAFMR